MFFTVKPDYFRIVCHSQAMAASKLIMISNIKKINQIFCVYIF
jgi:hypothetical protein